jgi:predicted membrane-bound spermidine synthase
VKSDNAYAYLTAFVGGLASLSVELAASSLLRPYFGTSNFVWAAIIGLILLYLTAGYYIGGRWADRFPHYAYLFEIVAWGGFLVGVIPFVAHPVLALTSRGFTDFDAGVLVGSFVAVLVLFSLPVSLLGCISPYVIRLAVSDLEGTGSTAGRVYAISTAGSFVGTFLPDLLLVPTIGTRYTFVLLSLLLLITALVGLLRTRPKRAVMLLVLPVIVMALAVSFGNRPIKDSPLAIYEAESGYNYIQVEELDDGCRQLLLNEGQGIHSVYCDDRLRTAGPWDYFLIAPFFNAAPYSPENVRSLALIGLAGGTIARQYTAAYGPLTIDGVEIDPKVVDTGRRYFAMDTPNLNIEVADGRFFLAHSERRYSVIGIDAYRLPYIPPHLTTVEFFHLVSSHLEEDGVLAINVGHTLTDYRLVRAFLSTLLQVFPSVHVIDVPNSFNAVIVATAEPTVPENLHSNLPTLIGDRLLASVCKSAIANLRVIEPDKVVFTDDRASIELMTNGLVFDYVLELALGG